MSTRNILEKIFSGSLGKLYNIALGWEWEVKQQ
jgi:hypothetical protein